MDKPKSKGQPIGWSVDEFFKTQKDERAKAPLLHALKQPVPELRLAAAEALGRVINEDDVKKALKEVLNDEDERVQKTAKEALERISELEQLEKDDAAEAKRKGQELKS